MKELTFVMTILVMGITLIFFALVFFNEPHIQEIKKLAPDCEYLGTPKDVHRVAIFDCNGVIEIRRKK
jgi:hypothetical protein